MGGPRPSGTRAGACSAVRSTSAGRKRRITPVPCTLRSVATKKEVLQVEGREVTVSNPDKVYFPRAGHAGRHPRPADGAQALRRRRRGRVLLPEARPDQPARVGGHGGALVSLGP